MDLVSIPANPVPEGAVTGTLKTRDGVTLRFARWHPPPGPQGHGVPVPGPRRIHREVFRDRARIARAAASPSPPSTGAGRAAPSARSSDPRKGHVGDFSEYERDVEALMNEVVLPDCPPPIFAIGHSMGGTVMMRVARQGSRWFDRIVLSAPMIRLAGNRSAAPAKITARAMRLHRHGLGLCAGRQRRRGRDRALRQQHRDLRSGASRPHQGGAGGGARARHRLADRVLAQRRLSRDGRDRRSRLTRARSASR